MWTIDNPDLPAQTFSSDPTTGLAQIVLGQLDAPIATIDFLQGYGNNGGFIYELETVEDDPVNTGRLFALDTGLNFAAASLVGHERFCFSRIHDPSRIYAERFWVYKDVVYILATENHPINPGEAVIVVCNVTVDIPEPVNDQMVLETGYADFTANEIRVEGLVYTPVASSPSVGEFTQADGVITLQVSVNEAPTFGATATLIGEINTTVGVQALDVKLFNVRGQLTTITYIDNVLYRAKSYTPAFDPWAPQAYELLYNPIQKTMFLFCPA